MLGPPNPGAHLLSSQLPCAQSRLGEPLEVQILTVWVSVRLRLSRGGAGAAGPPGGSAAVCKSCRSASPLLQVSPTSDAPRSPVGLFSDFDQDFDGEDSLI